MHRPLVAAAILVTLVSAGAGCGTQRVRAHAEVDAPPQAVAIVVCPGSMLEYVMIQRVDGVGIDRDSFTTTEIEVLPGRHTFEVAWVRGSFVKGTAQSTGNATVELMAEAGHRYVVKADDVREGFWPEVGKATLGGPGTWTAWIEDTATGTVVAGRRPTGTFTTSFE